MALRKVKGAVERVFDKNLNDLVRGIRAHKDDEAKFIATCIDEIKEELRQESMDVKANALLKLLYLQMLGYDISWACFNMVEVTSCPKFTFKRIGYLCASQAFRDDTDVIMLTTNLIKKDLGSSQLYDAANSLTGLSCFMTPDLARDLTNDIFTLLSSSKPYIRKKAVLIMYKIFLKYPDALRLAYPKLKERLDDPDPGVQSAAVNVICELARKNPKNYLALAPVFFRIMTNSTNNWMLIKIIKLFGALTPLEPRLGKKLIEPLTNLIHSTSAMSLLYECINTVVAVLISISSGMPQHNSSIQLCVQKLKILIEDNDQNLKYLGLLAMGNILKTHPKSVQPLKDLVLSCLDDKDESIRFRALDLLYGMINKKNLMEIVKKLMTHIEKAEGSQYRDELLSKIIEVCSHDNYKHITNFEWYISILVELTKMEGTRHGKLIASQMLDVAVRVRSIRQFVVTQMALLVENVNLLSGAIQRNGISEVLYAAGWIAGEFNSYLKNPKNTLMAMLRDRVVELPSVIQAVYIQNALKLYSRLVLEMREEEPADTEGIKDLTRTVLDRLPQFTNSPDMEVQERACVATQILKYIEKYVDKDEEIVGDFSALFGEDLNPVAPRAQRKVPVPEGLDLDEWINDPPSSSDEEDVPGATNKFVDEKLLKDTHGAGTFTEKSRELSAEEVSKAREEREKYVSSNMYYLKSNTSSKSSSPKHKPGSRPSEGDLPPVVKADIDLQLEIPGFSIESSEKKSKKKKKGKRAMSEDSEDDGGRPVVDIVAEELPEGAVLSDVDERDSNDPHRLLDIDLETISKPRSPEKKVEPVVKEKKKKKKKTAEVEEEIKVEEVVPEVPAEKPEKKKKKKKGAEVVEDAPPALASPEKKKKKSKKSAQPAEDPEPEPVAEKKKSKKKRLLKDIADTGEPEVPQEPEIDLLGGMDAATPPDAGASPVKETAQPKASGDVDDIDFWLDQSGSKSSNGNGSQDAYLSLDGIDMTANAAAPTFPEFTSVGGDDVLQVSFKTDYDKGCSANTFSVFVKLTNVSGGLLKNVELIISDSVNLKMQRMGGASVHDQIAVAQKLKAGAEVQKQLTYTFKDIYSPQKLKATVTYIAVSDLGSTQDKVDFKLGVPVSTFLQAAPCSSDSFTAMLSSGELQHKEQLHFPPTSDHVFSSFLAKLCHFLHLSVVEQIVESASLHALSAYDDHICILLKSLPSGGISCGVKCNSTPLITAVVAEIRQLMTPPPPPAE